MAVLGRPFVLSWARSPHHRGPVFGPRRNPTRRCRLGAPSVHAATRAELPIIRRFAGANRIWYQAPLQKRWI